MSCLVRAPAESTDSRLGMCLALPLGVPEENLRIALRKSWTERSFQPCWWQTWISLKRPFRGQDEGKKEEARPCPKGWRARSDAQRLSKIRFVSTVFLCVFIWTPPCCLASHDVANRRYILFCLTVVLKTSTLFPLLIPQIFARCSCCWVWLGAVSILASLCEASLIWSYLPMIRFACAKAPGIFVAQADWQHCGHQPSGSSCSSGSPLPCQLHHAPPASYHFFRGR